MLSTRDITKAKRRPRPKAIGTPIMTRVQADLLDKIDGWRSKQADNPNRPEAMRRLVESALKRAK